MLIFPNYTAYLKANFTPFYLAALLSTGTGYYGPGVYIQDGLRMGVKFLLPDINRSAHCFTVEDNAVRAGLGMVKGVGPAAVLAILESRSKDGLFQSLYDFCFRVRLSKKAVQNIIKGGAFDSFGLTRPTMLASLDKIKEAARRSRRHREAGQLSLLGEPSGETCRWSGSTGLEYGPSLPEYTRAQQLHLEKEIFGFYLTGHPLAQGRVKLSRRGVLPLNKLACLPEGATVWIAGQVVSARRQPTRKEEYMVILLLEDETAQIEVILSPRVYREYLAEITPGILSVRGYLSRREKDTRVLAREIESLYETVEKPKNTKAAVFP